MSLTDDGRAISDHSAIEFQAPLRNFALRCNLRRSPKFDQTFALNISQAFDLDYLKATKQLGDGRVVTLSFPLGFSSLKF